jgi:uncharacterized protein YoxC
MEIILYITGGIALLALAWLFISLSMAIGSVRLLIVEVRGDLTVMVETIKEVRSQILPILGNVNNITSNVTSITSGLQEQMVSVHETIDDALNVLRGTIDDIERLKDDVVATVEGPMSFARSASDGAVGVLFKGVKLLTGILGKKKDRGSKSDSDR